MVPRFSFFSRTPYDVSLINRLTSKDASLQDLFKAEISSNMVSADIISSATIASAENSTRILQDSIQSSTQTISSGLDFVALSNIFGSLMTVGAISVSTYILSEKIKEVVHGVERLGTIFTEGMSLLSSQLDIQTNSLVEIRDQLNQIHETLKSPNITQAVEWQRIGLERISVGLVPEAKEAFENAINYDSTDPLSNMMLGKIYLDGVDKDYNYHNAAISYEYFVKSIRYAMASMSKAPKLMEVYKEALYFSITSQMAIAMYQLNINGNFLTQIKEALARSEQLLKIDSEHRQARFLKSKLLLILEQKDDALEELKILISNDLDLISIPLMDEDFTNTSKGLEILAALELYYTDSLKMKIAQLEKNIKKAEELKSDIPVELIGWLNSRTIEEIRSNKYKIKKGIEQSLNHIIDLALEGVNGILIKKKTELNSVIFELKNKILSDFNARPADYLDESEYINAEIINWENIDNQLDSSLKVYLDGDDYNGAFLQIKIYETAVNNLYSYADKNKKLLDKFINDGKRKYITLMNRKSWIWIIYIGFYISTLAAIAIISGKELFNILLFPITLIFLGRFFYLYSYKRRQKKILWNISYILYNQLLSNGKSPQFATKMTTKFNNYFEPFFR